MGNQPLTTCQGRGTAKEMAVEPLGGVADRRQTVSILIGGDNPLELL